MKKLLFIFCLLISAALSAQLKFASVFTNNMVLQQNSEVSIWGFAKPGSQVLLKTTWQESAVNVAVDKNGCWKVKVQTPTVDYKSHRLELSEGDTQVVLNDIMLGEVWLCSGQSNMEMKMKGWYRQPIIGGPQAIMDSRNDQLRFCEVQKVFSCEEQAECKTVNGWVKASPATVATCSAAAYFFGRQLQRTLGVPVGLIIAPWGGANIVSYMSRESLAAFPECKLPVNDADIKSPNSTPAALYNAMIHPIVGYAMRGVIWYQGESNRYNPAQYKNLFKAMVADWREKWDIGEFPFYYAQIAPFIYDDKANSAFLREVQLQCEQEIPNTGMICLLDVGEKHNIHPAEKEMVGRRFAQIALDRTYDIDGIYSVGPIYKSMVVKDGKVVVSFEHASSGLVTYGQPLDQFEVAGKDRKFYPAQARIKGSQVILTSHEVKEPVAVRYGFSNYTKGTLYNAEGCPASSFRTDEW